MLSISSKDTEGTVCSWDHVVVGTGVSWRRRSSRGTPTNHLRKRDAEGREEPTQLGKLAMYNEKTILRMEKSKSAICVGDAANEIFFIVCRVRRRAKIFWRPTHRRPRSARSQRSIFSSSFRPEMGKEELTLPVEKELLQRNRCQQETCF